MTKSETICAVVTSGNLFNINVIVEKVEIKFGSCDMRILF